MTEIEIPKPCAEDWDRMTPGERGRFCASCQKTVHDLSAMTRDEARALLAQDGDMCVSYISEGEQVVFAAPKVVPLSRLTRRLPHVAAAGLSLALAACAPHGDGPSLEAQQETPVFLEVTPSIPVEGKAPERPDEPEDEPEGDQEGDQVVEPCDDPEPVADPVKIERRTRTSGTRVSAAPVLGRVRTKGDRIKPNLDPLEGL